MVQFVAYAVGFLVLLVLTQSVHVFPGVLRSLFSGRTRDPKSLPAEVESCFIETPDGKRLETWYLPPDPLEEKRSYCAVIFHGNGAPLENFFLVQLWFSSQGIPSYAFDYRGFGKSSGWPSEKGIEIDSDAVMNFVAEREQCSPDEMIVFGVSIGCAPAARAASLIQAKALVLVSPFTGLKQVVKEQLLFSLLSPFLWYRFPTIEYVRKLEQTHLLIAHGSTDPLIKPYHSEKILEAYNGSGESVRYTTEVPGHNSTFFALRGELAAALGRMID